MSDCQLDQCLYKAYAQGIHYPNYEWITLGSFENQWWRQYGNFPQEISCSEPDNVFNTMLNRGLVILPYPDEQVHGMIPCMLC